MGKLENEYGQHLGKLYVYPARHWTTGKGWVDVRQLLMPVTMQKIGGWWHYDCEKVNGNLDNNPDYVDYKTPQISYACKEFLRSSRPALSLLGDTR